MNHTLFHFGFKKEVETKSGRLFDVSAGLSKSVQFPDKPVKCEFCNNSYAGKKYLDTHVRFKHPSQYSKLSQSSSETTISSKDLDKSANETARQQVVDKRQETCDLTELEGSDSGKTNNRQGADQRKSYTMDFKIKTLDLLNAMRELKMSGKRLQKEEELASHWLLGCPASPVINSVFGRLWRKTASRGREDTRVWYRETMFSQMVSYRIFSCTNPCTDTFCTSSPFPLKNPQGVANLKKPICVVRSDFTLKDDCQRQVWNAVAAS